MTSARERAKRWLSECFFDGDKLLIDSLTEMLNAHAAEVRAEAIRETKKACVEAVRALRTDLTNPCCRDTLSDAASSCRRVGVKP